MKLNKRERTLLFVTIGVVLVVLNYWLVVPLAKNWRSVRGDLVNREAALRQVRETIAMAPQWQSELDKLHSQFSQKAVRFDDTTDVLKKLEEVGQQAGVSFTARRPLPAENKGDYSVLPVTCTIEAGIEPLVKFLFSIQTAAGFMSVEQLQVSPRPDNSSILRCDVQVRALSGKAEGRRS